MQQAKNLPKYQTKTIMKERKAKR